MIVRPGQRNASGRAHEARDPAQRLFRPPPRRARRSASTTRSPAGSRRSPATSDATASGSTRQARAAPRLLRHRDPLRRSSQLRRAPRRRRRGQPARSVASRRDAARARAERHSEGAAALPHLIAVSTAYVNSGHKGDAAEELITSSTFVSKTDWRAEVAAARRARADADAESRSRETPGRASPRRRGQSSVRPGRRCSPTDRAAASRLGRRPPGRARTRPRARALGWPDAYAYTKSLGEHALLDMRGELPVTFVRPSIVESSLARAPPRVDPRLSHGRASHHLLRPRACCASSPGFPRASWTSSPSTSSSPPYRRGSERSRRGRTDGLPSRLRRPEPAALRTAGRPHRAVVHRATPL